MLQGSAIDTTRHVARLRRLGATKYFRGNSYWSPYSTNHRNHRQRHQYGNANEVKNVSNEFVLGQDGSLPLVPLPGYITGYNCTALYALLVRYRVQLTYCLFDVEHSQ